MFKNKKTIIITSIIVAIIIVGITAGIVTAQNEEETQNPRQQLMGRVAEILGIDQQKLEDAFRQAIKEQREKMLDDHLQKLIDGGKLTTEQANKYKEWLKSRPDIPFPEPRRFGMEGGPMPKGWGWHGECPRIP